MGDATEFTVKWGSRSISTYSVPGNTYEEVFKFFQNKKHKREDWVKVTFSHSINMDVNKPPKEIWLKMAYTIEMPEWSKVSSQTAKAKTAWRTMVTAAKKHAQKHAALFEDEVDKLCKATDKEADFRKWSGLYRQFAETLKKAHESYDSRSANGEKEGVMLPPPDKVKG